MDPITASGVFSIGKELLSKAATSFAPSGPANGSKFSEKLEAHQKASVGKCEPGLRLQNLEEGLKADLLNDPKTASFFQQNQNNKIYLEKRADGSVQFLSSNGQSLVLETDSPHCSKANELLDLCFENKFNLTTMRPNAVAFNS